MKSEIGKLVCPAAAAILVLIGIKGFDNPISRADAVAKGDSLNNIHSIKLVKLRGDVTEKEEIWLKNKRLFRKESGRWCIIDNGRNTLSLDRQDKTAELKQSCLPYGPRTFDNLAYEQILVFQMLEMFKNKQPNPNFEVVMSPQDSNDKMLVYRIGGPGEWRGKVWVGAKSSLPLKVIAEDCTDEEYHGSRERSIEMEAHFDYEPIADEIFSTVAPAGYKLERVVYPEVMSGTVVDQHGNPVAGAQVYTSFKSQSKTNENGEFALCKSPVAPPADRLHPRDFPVFVRAFQEDNPNEVAWTIIRYREWHDWHFHVRASVSSTLRSEQEWEKIRLKWRQEEPEDTDGVKLFVRDENQLANAIAGDPGELFGNGYSSKDRKQNYGADSRRPKSPRQARDIVLVMASASVISGRLTNTLGKPIQGAVVSVEEMKMKFGKNRLFLRHLGSERKPDWRPFAVTDENGRYRLGNLPAPWDKLRLQVRAQGYKVAPVEMTGGAAKPGQAQIVRDFDIQLIEQGRQDTELPVITHGRRPEVLFGRVVDEQGKPVADARICTSIQAKGSADKDGNFAIKLPPSRISGVLGGDDFPIFIRAFKKDDPDHVAWALLTNPKPAGSKPQARDVTVRDIVLVMQPAGMVAGRIGDEKPVPNVTVWIESLEVKTGDEVITLGNSESDWTTEWWPRAWMPFAPTRTDKDGRYRFRHLPASWCNVKIRAMSKGYSTAQAEFGRHWEGIAKRCDFILFAR